MFKAEKAAMASALAITNSVVERRSTIPILQNVLIEKDGASIDKLIARFTNLDIEATVRFSAEVGSDFEAFTVPAGTLSDIVNKLPDGVDVAILPDRTNGLTGVTLKAGRSRFKLPVLPADDFATMKIGELPYSLTLPAPELAAVLADVALPCRQKKPATTSTAFSRIRSKMAFASLPPTGIAFRSGSFAPKPTQQCPA